MDTDTHPFQENLERSARLSSLLLMPAPPAAASMVLILVAGAVAGVFLGATPAAVGEGVLLIALPGLLAAGITTTIARVLGGTLYYRRAAFIALIGAVVALVGTAVGLLAGLVGAPQDIIVFYALAVQLTFRQGVLTIISDHRHVRTLTAASVQPLASLPAMGLVFQPSPETWALGLALWVVILGPFMLVQSLFDAPLSRNFGVSASQVFRHYLDHITTGAGGAEDLFGRVGEPVEAPVAVLAFRRLDGSAKACIVVPSVHPGPFGALGGGDLPLKIAEAMPKWPHVLVPHAAANHDLNPVSTVEVERLAAVAANLADTVPTQRGGGAVGIAGSTVRVCAQAFGDHVLLTYTSWPEAIDDVDYGVGLAAELEAQNAGFTHAVFVDCHNSLRPSAGAVFPLSPRALEIQRRAREAAAKAAESKGQTLHVGVAQEAEAFGPEALIGAQGCQVLVTDCAGMTTAYVLWDGNNMLPEATRAVREAVLQVVDECLVMTTDNHSVNVAGAFSPVGARVSFDALARVAKDTTQAALDDLEEVTSGLSRDHVPGLKVFGHHKTAQMAASLNTMMSVIPELVVVCVGAWVLGSALVFLLL